MKQVRKFDVAGLDLKGGGGFLDGLQEACTMKLQWNWTRYSQTDGLKLDRIKNCNTIVAHVHNEHWENIVKQAKSGCVCIRVQSAGFGTPDVPTPKSTGNQIVLHLLPAARKLVRDDWVTILEGVTSPEELQRLLNGTGSSLDGYFRHSGTDHLLALAVLCQGYLVVHAVKRDQEWGPAAISTALREMEWPSFMERGGEVQRQIERRIEDTKTRQRLKKDVARPDWWQKALATSDPVSLCSEEWGPRKGEAWAKLAPLLAMIREGRTIPEPAAERHPVADAFQGLRERLERRQR